MKTDIQQSACAEQETVREEHDTTASLSSKLAEIPQLSTLIHALTSDRALTALSVAAAVAGFTLPDQGIIWHPG